MFFCQRTPEGWEVVAKEDGKEAAKFALIGQGESLFVHNIINLWTARSYRLYREAFSFIKDGMRKSGFKFLVTCSVYSDALPKRKKYWRMMGFHIFTNINVMGRDLMAAGLEL